MGTQSTWDSPCVMASQNVSKKRKFVADGVFFAELNELFTRELAEDGYSGVEVRQTPARHEIIIRATRTQNVLGEEGRRIRELTAVVQTASDSFQDPLSCTPRRFSAVVCAQSPRQRLSNSSTWEVSPSVAHAMALSATSWRAVHRVLR